MPVPVFDLDGTLLDSDEALVAPFLALGVPREDVIFGRLLAEECDRLGITTRDYLDLYDDTSAAPFPGVDSLVAGLGRWAVCSNKHPGAGQAELRRLGWQPEVALFSDAFGGGGKRLGPVLEALDLAGEGVVFIGDTEHDRRCAEGVGCRFILAGWNPRAEPSLDDTVVASPQALADLLG